MTDQDESILSHQDGTSGVLFLAGHFVFSQDRFTGLEAPTRRVGVKMPGPRTRDSSYGPRRADAGLRLGDAASVTRARTGKGTATLGATSTPAAPSRLRPQRPMAAATLRLRAQVSACPVGHHRPHPTRSLKLRVQGACSHPAAQPRASRTVRRSWVTSGVTGCGRGFRAEGLAV